MIGVILGRAFDRALTIVIDRWPVFVGGWAVAALMYLLHAAGWLMVVTGALYSPIAGSVVGKYVRGDVRIPTLNIVTCWGTTLMSSIAVLGLPTLIITPIVLLPAASTPAPIDTSPSDLVLGLALLSLPFVFVCWMGTMFSLAQASALFDGLSIRRSVSQSWRLIRGHFWAMLGFNVLFGAAIGAMLLIPTLLAMLILELWNPGILDKSPAILDRYIPAGLGCVMVYAVAAYWSASLLCLDWLGSARAKAAPAAP